MEDLYKRLNITADDIKSMGPDSDNEGAPKGSHELAIKAQIQKAQELGVDVFFPYINWEGLKGDKAGTLVQELASVIKEFDAKRKSTIEKLSSLQTSLQEELK